LKDIVLLLQRAATAAGPETLSVRTKFMIDTVNDLKNNKLKAGVAQSALTTDHLIRMRKTLGTLNVRNVKVTEPMRIGLADIRDTDKRGKWWLVGASWKGRDRDAQHSALSEDVEDQPEDEEASGEPDLLLLARNMGMNTDIRRAIFVTIMSAVDYKDAQLKLLKLNLTRTQQVEIPRVLLHCVGAAQHYNPFYAVLARQYCSDHKLRKAFTFVLWSLFKKLGERGPDDDAASSEDEDDEQNNGTGLAGIVNQAQFFARLIATGGLDLSMLKVNSACCCNRSIC
jgi:nucleolar MIF4G domain-containing protein 1